jgi:hypothetical protein
MCDLCELDKVKFLEAAAHERMFAQELRSFANGLDDLAAKRMVPHGPEAKNMALLAKMLIRKLVEEWL